MKREVHLFNREGADLKIVLKPSSGIYVGTLKTDPRHSYCLDFMRIIYDGEEIEAVDPSGGPFISVGQEFSGYKIIKIINATMFLVSENNNN